MTITFLLIGYLTVGVLLVEILRRIDNRLHEGFNPNSFIFEDQFLLVLMVLLWPAPLVVSLVLAASYTLRKL